MSSTARVGREVVLWIGGVLGALCLTALVAGWLFNVTPLVFASGSMSPEYDAGALGFAREVPAADLRTGEVVSVVSAEGNRVTHRIVDVQAQGEAAVLTLKGDTNTVADAQTYTVTTADRVGLGVPYAGYALNAAASPFGMVAVGAFVLVALYLGFGRGGDRSARPRSRRARLVVPVGLASVVALGGALGASGQAPWAFTSAYWTDTATATTTATTPAAVSHAQPVCTSLETTPKKDNQPATLTWLALGAEYEYHWELRKVGDPGVVSSGTVGVGATPPTVVTLAFPIVPGGGNNANYNAIVQTRLVSDHSNVGPSTTTPLHTNPEPNGPNWSAYCGHR